MSSSKWRIKELLPQAFRSRVTSFYWQHLEKIKVIQRTQLYFLYSSMNLFKSCADDNISRHFIAQEVYQFSSLNEVQLLPKTCKSLKPIPALYYSINEVQFSDSITTTSDKNTVTAHISYKPSHAKDTLSTAAIGFATKNWLTPGRALKK